MTSNPTFGFLTRLNLTRLCLHGCTPRVELTQWYGSKHNMGMAFNRTTWQKLRSCTSPFCSFDDYNWDWSLQYISQTGCIGQKLQAMLIKAPRVFHIGEW